MSFSQAPHFAILTEVPFWNCHSLKHTCLVGFPSLPQTGNFRSQVSTENRVGKFKLAEQSNLQEICVTWVTGTSFENPT